MSDILLAKAIAIIKKEINTLVEKAVDELSYIQFVDNTASEGEEAQKQVERVIKELGKRFVEEIWEM